MPNNQPQTADTERDSIVHAAEDIAGLLADAKGNQREDLLSALDQTLHEAQVAVVDLNAEPAETVPQKRGARTKRTREEVILASQNRWSRLGRYVLISGRFQRPRHYRSS